MKKHPNTEPWQPRKEISDDSPGIILLSPTEIAKRIKSMTESIK